MTKYSLLCFMILTSCQKEVDSRRIFSFTNLTEKYNIKDLYSFDYDKTDRVYVLGYSEKYEIRDENFNILRQGTLPGSVPVVYAKGAVYDGSAYYPTNDGQILYFNHNTSDISLIDSASKLAYLLYTDPYHEFVSSFVETDQYYVFAFTSQTTCVFIEKATKKVISFTDYFMKNGIDKGLTVVKDQQGNIILSTYGKHLVYNNGTWSPFQPTKFDGGEERIVLVDSRNYLWINNYLNNAFLIFDMNKAEYLDTNPKLLSGNYFGLSIKEHSSGDILVLSGESLFHDLIQVHLDN